MHKYLIVSLFCILPTLQAKAQLLWEISGNQLPRPSYLYGTMHVSDKRVFQFADSVMAKFDQCETFAGELDFDPSMVFQMLPYLFMPGDTTLQDLFTEEEYTLVSKKLGDDLGMVAAFAERMRPIFISVLLTDVEGVETGGQPLDLYFQQLAREKEMQVVGLETFEEQIGVFNAIPLADQAAMLLEDVKNGTKAKEEQQDLVALYTSQNIDSLYLLARGSLDEDMNARMLDDRNHIMASRIETLVKSSPAFIGVGAAHLAGEKGLIALLRKAGYQLKPIN